MTAKIILRINHAHIAEVMRVRHEMGIGEGFKVLPPQRQSAGYCNRKVA
jgi:hypothetical protein